ncbi:MAG TPA: TIGR03118 family protein [Candidatus Acidoferrum sp.]|nr:TIGR03118 family protein [Candidatus Acidoferrum sp.]
MYQRKNTLTKNINQGRGLPGQQIVGKGLLAVAAAVSSVLFLVPASGAAAFVPGVYNQTNLVSDSTGHAAVTDSKLVNPWGLVHNATSPWWISDNGTGSSSIYSGAGVSVRPVVAIPDPSGAAGKGTPTGVVYNEVSTSQPTAFVIKKGTVSGPSTFIFATEDGTIAGWNKTVDGNNAIIAIDHSKTNDGHGHIGAVYKGLAYGFNGGKPYIYATNFRFGVVDVFDATYHFVMSFSDPNLVTACLSQCYAPFGIQNIGGKLYVSFALQDSAKHDDIAGSGHGYVDVFSTNGTFLKRLISRGLLNSPWGMALAPKDFGGASNQLLVGNFGDGTITSYNFFSGLPVGKLIGKSNQPIHIDGLWGLAFGNDHLAGKHNELFFTAGFGGEAHGLFGKIVKQ